MFVALDLPDDVRGGLEAWGARELTDPALRPVPPEALHITLCFLGWQRERDAEAIAAEIDSARREAVEMRFEPKPVAVPRDRKPPRLFAVEAPSPAADSLAAEVCGLLERARFYRPEKRPFWSHVTVARVRSEKPPKAPGDKPGRRRRGRPRRVERPPESLPDELLQPFGAVRVRLYRSNLRPAGAEYVPLADFDLPQGPPRDVKGDD
jgi:RNA 2',3'-cyclic 3'-phosphodiesterase